MDSAAIKRKVNGVDIAYSKDKTCFYSFRRAENKEEIEDIVDMVKVRPKINLDYKELANKTYLIAKNAIELQATEIIDKHTYLINEPDRICTSLLTGHRNPELHYMTKREIPLPLVNVIYSSILAGRTKIDISNELDFTILGTGLGRLIDGCLKNETIKKLTTDGSEFSIGIFSKDAGPIYNVAISFGKYGFFIRVWDNYVRNSIDLLSKYNIIPSREYLPNLGVSPKKKLPLIEYMENLDIMYITSNGIMKKYEKVRCFLKSKVDGKCYFNNIGRSNHVWVEYIRKFNGNSTRQMHWIESNTFDDQDLINLYEDTNDFKVTGMTKADLSQYDVMNINEEYTNFDD